jgi:hypothetical protein
MNVKSDVLFSVKYNLKKYLNANAKRGDYFQIQAAKMKKKKSKLSGTDINSHSLHPIVSTDFQLKFGLSRSCLFCDVEEWVLGKRTVELDTPVRVTCVV